jgi:hypothetical protein
MNDGNAKIDCLLKAYQPFYLWFTLLSPNNRSLLNLLPVFLQELTAIIMRHIRDKQAFRSQLSRLPLSRPV